MNYSGIRQYNCDRRSGCARTAKEERKRERAVHLINVERQREGFLVSIIVIVRQRFKKVRFALREGRNPPAARTRLRPLDSRRLRCREREREREREPLANKRAPKDREREKERDDP
jgi:hypothetical protein